jgi:hypothetical protein
MADSDSDSPGCEKPHSAGNEIPNGRAAEDYSSRDTYGPIWSGDRDECLAIRKMASRASRTLQHSWSLNDGYSSGHGAHPNETESEVVRNGNIKTAAEPELILVGWDENDPMNPRNMRSGRKWLIVLLVSLGSACV